MFGIPFLTPGLLIKGGCILAIVGAIGFAGFEVVHTIRKDAVKDLVAADTATNATRQAVLSQAETKVAQIDAASASTAATHQIALATTAAVIKQKVTTHVHVLPPGAPAAPGCVTYGLVRQHDAAALGVDPDTLQLPAGASDDACSPITAPALADAISDNYAAARANAQELTDLQANAAAKAVDTQTPKQ